MKKYPVHLIAKPTLLDEATFEDGNTNDIITTIVEYGDKHCASYTKRFAPFLKGKTLNGTCGNIHAFIKAHIPYVLDPKGFQWVKSPGRLFQEKAGDCKSFSVFTASILKNLGIEYGYRFVSYKTDDPTPTHVYVYVPVGGTEIIIDAVWNGPFNTQKPYAHKKDILMPKIMYLGATEPDGHIAGMLTINKPIEDLTEGELSLLLARQKLEIDKQNVATVGGHWKTPGYDRSLKMVNHLIRNVDRPEVIVSMGERLEAHPDARVAGLGKFVKKIGKGIAKGVKAVAKTGAKIATAPIRLAAKGVLEIYLPKAAPMFLYLFTAPGINLPDKMRRKKSKAEKFRSFVCKKIGMKEAHFMSIIRNSLTKRYKQSPESYLAAKLKKAGIGAIGFLKQRVNQQRIGSTVNKVSNLLNKVNSSPVVDVAGKAASGNFVGAIISAISWIIQKLGGKKEDALVASDMPDPEADAGNAVDFQKTKEDYSTLTDEQRTEVKDTASQLIENNADINETRQTLNQLNYLTDEQKAEVTNEVGTGFDPITEQESNALSYEVKRGGNIDPYNNGGGGGFCKC